MTKNGVGLFLLFFDGVLFKFMNNVAFMLLQARLWSEPVGGPLVGSFLCDFLD